MSTKLLDKNMIELKNGDIVQYENNDGTIEGKPDKVVCYNNVWYIETIPNPKGSLFCLTNFDTDIHHDGKYTVIVLNSFKRLE